MVSARCGFRADWHNSLRRLATTRMQAIVSSALMMKPSRSFRRSSLYVGQNPGGCGSRVGTGSLVQRGTGLLGVRTGTLHQGYGPVQDSSLVGLETVVKF